MSLNMVKKIKSIQNLLLLIGLVVITTAHALPEDKDKVMNLAADSADLNQEQHKGTYLGKVKFDQGSTHLRADSAITLGDDKNKLDMAEAKGNKEKQAHYWTKTAEDKPLLHAHADLIRYYPKKNLIELIGNAKISQGLNSFSAPKISYDTLKKQVFSSKEGEQRTTIIIYPEKKHD